MSFPTRVVDETGVIHQLASEPLGRGGQGVVFETKTPGVAVKLITGPATMDRTDGSTASVGLRTLLKGLEGNAAEDDGAVSTLRARLDEVSILPLEDLNIARPTALLKTHAGYVMRLLTDMEPIAALLAPPGCDELAEFYLQTGGLRRRLRVLAAAARLIGRLHARPIVYGDVSPYNVFISSDPVLARAWLIDPDNLHIEGTPGPAVYTPGFGAPEVLQRRSRPTTLSDAWSFGVLAFWTLCQAHPMLGELVEAGDWEGEVDLEEQAMAGLLPWIHDVEDDSNYGEAGVFPREMVMSSALTELAQRTFGHSRRDPACRPGVSEWADALQLAADLTLTCPACGSTFYVNAQVCPWCDAGEQPEFLYLRAKRWHPEVDDELSPAGSSVAHHVFDGAQSVATVPRRIFTPSLDRDEEEPWVRLERTRSGYVVSPIAGGPYLLAEASTGRVVDLTSATALPLPVAGQEWHLHCGAMDRGHRVVSFRFFRRSRR